MAQTIFYSWQSDKYEKVCRYFLREALEDACKLLAADVEVAEANRDLSVDSDTRDVAGQPPIVETIFRKISEAGIFVGDMTFVGAADKGPISNPNVLIEYGWALKSLSHERVICAMNSAFGEPSETALPFNMRHVRWPIRYNLPEDASSEVRKAVKQKLVADLARAIRLSLAVIPLPPVTPQLKEPLFIAAEPKDGPARFRAAGEPVGIKDDFPMVQERMQEIYLSSGPAMWLRIMPEIQPQKEWSAADLKAIAMKERSVLMPLLTPAGGYSYVRGADGIGMYRGGDSVSLPESTSIEVKAVAFALSTGEIWSVETAWLALEAGRVPFVEDYLTARLRDYIEFLQRLGLETPYRWIAGMTGIKHRRLDRPPPPDRNWIGQGPICLLDTIQADGLYAGKQGAKEALKPFFEKIFKACGETRPGYLDQ